MKLILFFLFVGSVAVVQSGCGESRASLSPSVPVTPASTYKAGLGLQLSEAARSFIGLRTGEVTAHRFAESGEASAIPVSALLRTIKGDFVYVVNGDAFLRTAVITGAADASHLEIKGGLYDGDAVVTHGVRALSLAEIQALNGGVGCADGH